VTDAVDNLESSPELAGGSMRRLKLRNHITPLHLFQELL